LKIYLFKEIYLVVTIVGQVCNSQEKQDVEITVNSIYEDEGKLFQDILEEIFLVYVIEKLN
jgi:hypothetical protein